MHRRGIIALAALALSVGAYAADNTSGDASQDRGSAVGGENSTPSTGRTGSSSMGTDASGSVDRSVDTRRSGGDMGYTNSRSVDEDTDASGARTGGYLAAGIGIAALIGLFASRRNRSTRGRRSGTSHRSDDDFNRPSGVGPRV